MMCKIIVVVCLILAAAKGEVVKDVDAYQRDVYNADEYINLSRRHFAKAIQDYDTQLKEFAENYSRNVEEINLYLVLLTDSIVQIEDRLNSWEILGGLRKQCVIQHRNYIPNVLWVENEFASCVQDASSQIISLLDKPLMKRNALQHHYKDELEKNIKNCGKHVNTTQNYINCISSAISYTNEYTTENQKAFQYQLEAAECSAKISLKKTLDCYYSIQYNTTSLIAKTNALNDYCLSDKEDCITCFTCPNIQNMEVNFRSEVMDNPFYRHTSHGDCLLLEVTDLEMF